MGMNFIHPTKKWGKRIVTPADLSPYAWYDASNSSSVIQSGGLVSQWSDISGNGKHLTQATASARPTTGTTQNGLDVLGFSTSSVDIPRYVTASTASDWTFLYDGTTNVVIAAAARPITGNSGVICGTHSGNVANPGASFGFVPSSSSNGRITHAVSIGGGQSIIFFVGDTVVHSYIGSALNLWQSGAVFHDFANRKYFRFYIHPYNTFASVAMSANPFYTSATQPLRVGTISTATTSNTTKWVGYIGEIVIVRGAGATAENAFALREYLRAKWGTL